jgi:hypothetical protein
LQSLLFGLAVTAFFADFYQMGRIFWGILIVWMLAVRLAIVIKRPKAPQRQGVADGGRVA